MLVCHCRAIRAIELRGVIALGACTPSDVARACGAGAICGGCVPVIVELIAEHGAALTPRAPDSQHDDARTRGRIALEGGGACRAATAS